MWISIHFHIPYIDSHILLRNHVDFRGSMLCVSSQGIWKILVLLGFPRWFDVDFSVDFMRKKIPDEQMNIKEYVFCNNCSETKFCVDLIDSTRHFTY